MILTAPERVTLRTLLGYVERPKTIYLYLPKAMTSDQVNGPILQLLDLAVQDGWSVCPIAAREEWQELIGRTPHLHINLTREPASGPNIMNYGAAYLPGYWTFDDLGQRAHASTRLRTFDPKAMSWEFADTHLRGLRDRFVRRNIPTLRQPEAGKHRLKDGALVFFAQGRAAKGQIAPFLSQSELLKASIAAKGDRPLYIKPHPNASQDDNLALADHHKPDDGIEVVDRPLHDLLAVSDVSISLNSAASFVGFLHWTPAILGAASDFWQNAVTITDPAQLPTALTKARSTQWPFAKFLVWYLRHNAVQNTEEGVAKMLARLSRKGVTFGDSAPIIYDFGRPL